jgi:opacity protein-like surface antigen
MTRILILVVAITLASASLDAQQPSPAVVRGFATFGSITFHAQDSFDAVFDRHTGPVFGGGGQVLLPSGVYIEVAASRFTRDGERAFVTATGEVFRLGIPVDLTITPLEITGGWRFRRWRRVVPYGGAGYSSYRYQESSDFADPDENVDARFSGFHVVGGAEFQPRRWLAVGGEVAWASIPNALGSGGVSAALGEDNLGGTTLRVKISVGQ